MIESTIRNHPPQTAATTENCEYDTEALIAPPLDVKTKTNRIERRLLTIALVRCVRVALT